LQSLDESEGGRRDLRLEHKSLTAFKLAWHLASSHVPMLGEVADHKFDTAPRWSAVNYHAVCLCFKLPPDTWN
jgi:hypothetical protein